MSGCTPSSLTRAGSERSEGPEALCQSRESIAIEWSRCFAALRMTMLLLAHSSPLSGIPVRPESEPGRSSTLQALSSLLLPVELDVPHLSDPDAEAAIERELRGQEQLHTAARSSRKAR